LVKREEYQKKYKEIIPITPKSMENCKITFPDGKEAILPILKGTQGPPMIDIRNLYQQTGYFTFDPGFFATGSCASLITYIDGDKGQLWHRGYKIEDLAEKCTFIEVCYLLLYGTLPSESELKKFEDAVVSEMLVHEQLINFYKGFKSGAHPMAIMVGVVGALSAFMHDELDVMDPKNRELAAIRLIAKMPTIAAIAFRTAAGLPIVYPKKQYNFTENFLYMMFSDPMSEWKISQEIVRAIDVICILHADHEQNASTSTVRIAGSSLANPFACVAAGIASLWGPAHGGANEAVLNMLEEIGTPDRIQLYINKAKDKNDSFRLMGFGHRVYKNFDPRAKIMQKICYDVIKVVGIENQPLLDLAVKLEQEALKDEYFISRKLYPNVDFYTGLVYKSIGMPKNMFTVMFAVARSVGWISQWQEMMSEGVIKIGRPRQLYIGPELKEIPEIKNRKEEAESKVVNITHLHDALANVKLG